MTKRPKSRLSEWDQEDHLLSRAIANTLLCLRQGRSTDEIAIVTGMSHSTYGHYERGDRIPNMRTLWRLSGSLGTSFADLAKRIEEEHSRLQQKQMVNRSARLP